MPNAFSPAATSSALLEQRGGHYRAGRLKDAKALYRPVLVLEPDQGDVLAGLGVVLFLQCHTDEAVIAPRRASRIGPGNAGTLYKLGNMLQHEGGDADRIAECFDCFRRHARLTFGTGAKEIDSVAHRIRHDREQQAYLPDNFGITDWKFHLSDVLFHETDRMHFKDGYTNRRINITMLYGRR